jgi:hypothetical protein
VKEYGAFGEIIRAGKNGSTQIKPCPATTLSTTNPTWTSLGSNPEPLGERAATNRLSHGLTTIVNPVAQSGVRDAIVWVVALCSLIKTFF